MREGTRQERPLGEVEVSGFVVHGWAAYHLQPWGVGRRERTLLALRPSLGVRNVRLPLRARGESDRIDLAGTVHWTDPVVGARLLVDFQNGWLVDAQLDLGGFAVGSDAALWGELRGQFNFWQHAGVWLGYTAYQAWFSPGGQFVRKVSLLMQGPGAGITFYVP